MIGIEELKNSIVNKTVKDSMMVFVWSDTDFICYQYINEISKIRNLPIEHIDSIDSIVPNGLFDNVDDSLQILACDSLDSKISEDNLIIVTKKIGNSVKDFYDGCTCVFPKIEDWQIKDYTYSILPEVRHEDLDYLISLCNNNLYRISSEIDKLKIFDSNLQKLYNEFKGDDIFSDLGGYTIFDLTNSILKKDVNEVRNILLRLSAIDVEPLGLVTILINSIRNIISIQFDPRVTPEDLGVTRGRFWAIKHSCGVFSNSKLVSIFQMLLRMDRELKLGNFPTEYMIDYILTNILM